MKEKFTEKAQKKLETFVSNSKNHKVIQKYRAINFYEIKKTNLKVGDEKILKYRTAFIFPDFIGVAGYVDGINDDKIAIKACQILQKRINKMLKDNEDLPVSMSDEQLCEFLDFFNKDFKKRDRDVSFYELIHCGETESVIVKPCSVRQSWRAILLNFFSKNKKQF